MLDVDKNPEWENPITGVADFRTKTTAYKPVDNIARLLRKRSKPQRNLQAQLPK